MHTKAHHPTGQLFLLENVTVQPGKKENKPFDQKVKKSGRQDSLFMAIHFSLEE